MLSFSASTLVSGNLCGISRFWHQLPTYLSVNRQGSLLAIVNLPWHLNPHTHQHPVWCELPIIEAQMESTALVSPNLCHFSQNAQLNVELV